MFKLFLGLLICAGAFATPRTEFCAKLRSIAIVFWSQDNLCKIADSIIEDIRVGLPMQNISSKMMGYVTKNTPILDYSKLLKMMNTMDSCLQGTNSKTMDVIGLALPVFINQLQNPYNVIRTKMVTMQGNKKPVAEQTTQAYTLGIASVTKPLIQTIITNSSKKMNLKQWTCAVQNLPALIAIAQYNTKKP